jgi:hypothetical protein
MIIIIIMMTASETAAVGAATSIATMMMTPYSLSLAFSTSFWQKWALKYSNARKDLLV